MVEKNSTSPDKRKACIGVLFGGRSGEHEVSLASAQSIIENIDQENLSFIEVQTGDYFGEDDIERIEDDFGRE